MSSNEYFLVWLVYAGASFFVIMFWFWITGFSRSMMLKSLLRFPVIVILLTPIPHVLDHSLYVPAVAAVAFDVLAKDSTHLLKDATALGSAVILSIVFAIAFSVFTKMMARRIHE